VTTGTALALIVLCALTTLLTRGIGPAAVGGRELPAPLVRVVLLLASALLAALVVTSALADGPQLHVGADTAGVAFAGVLLWRKAPVLVVVIGAAVVTAGLRALGVD
jgi:branched-subunit amino acid transport protein